MTLRPGPDPSEAVSRAGGGRGEEYPHPLAALVRLLAAVPSVTAGKLGTTASEAADALGVDVVVHLVDDEQRHLVPINGEGHPRLDVEGTLAGRAFRSGHTLVTRREPARWWVPLVDGFERLGVLEVVPRQALHADDPDLRQQLGWFANLLAHLVTAADQQGDTVEQLRRTRPRSASAELIWALLPPPEAGSDHLTLSGRLEPAYAVGGDAFDYALDADSVELAIIDAMGHELGAGLITATAIATYRAARRAGHGLGAQAAAIDEALRANFPDAFATGILARLDLATGRLSYLCAGHPAPLVLREGRVIGALEAGRRLPFGLETADAVPGETVLEREDCLVLHTDGITEARDPTGTPFGHRRLVDFLEREAAARLTTAETTRRLIQAVLRHQQDRLEDDATVLLVRWSPPPSPNPSDRTETA